jgi:hypothetical protein
VTMRALVLAALACPVAAMIGCSGESRINCEDVERYSTASSAPPVQIPDDLSPPNESDAIRLPPDVAASRQAPSEPCLELPPSFSGAGRPGRAAREAAGAAEAAEPAATSDERAIDD